jgi:hypothetical protein
MRKEGNLIANGDYDTIDTAMGTLKPPRLRPFQSKPSQWTIGRSPPAPQLALHQWIVRHPVPLLQSPGSVLNGVTVGDDEGVSRSMLVSIDTASTVKKRARDESIERLTDSVFRPKELK